MKQIKLPLALVILQIFWTYVWGLMGVHTCLNQ